MPKHMHTGGRALSTSLRSRLSDDSYRQKGRAIVVSDDYYSDEDEVDDRTSGVGEGEYRDEGSSWDDDTSYLAQYDPPDFLAADAQERRSSESDASLHVTTSTTRHRPGPSACRGFVVMAVLCVLVYPFLSQVLRRANFTPQPRAGWASSYNPITNNNKNNNNNNNNNRNTAPADTPPFASHPLLDDITDITLAWAALPAILLGIPQHAPGDTHLNQPQPPPPPRNNATHKLRATPIPGLARAAPPQADLAADAADVAVHETFARAAPLEGGVKPLASALCGLLLGALLAGDALGTPPPDSRTNATTADDMARLCASLGGHLDQAAFAWPAVADDVGLRDGGNLLSPLAAALKDSRKAVEGVIAAWYEAGDGGREHWRVYVDDCFALAAANFTFAPPSSVGSSSAFLRPCPDPGVPQHRPRPPPRDVGVFVDKVRAAWAESDSDLHPFGRGEARFFSRVCRRSNPTQEAGPDEDPAAFPHPACMLLSQSHGYGSRIPPDMARAVAAFEQWAARWTDAALRDTATTATHRAGVVDDGARYGELVAVARHVATAAALADRLGAAAAEVAARWPDAALEVKSESPLLGALRWVFGIFAPPPPEVPRAAAAAAVLAERLAKARHGVLAEQLRAAVQALAVMAHVRARLEGLEADLGALQSVSGEGWLANEGRRRRLPALEMQLDRLRRLERQVGRLADEAHAWHADVSSATHRYQWIVSTTGTYAHTGDRTRHRRG
ncbi:hypothetical protein B0T24DRAFT_678490 [Lasiosphaeria ovina]|uniref:Uncharacterized protein n=1 Tax=Lasiosphaeria ovina TaxID=92902 RepID=A0AAE0KBS3_9PEZI|nr:hypothetical protein B0T24DRAFT_678490 [Lasiosphaeria ovina]